jgi:methylmalonyl-CoA/ethylmalonyl-CoA epimerase
MKKSLSLILLAAGLAAFAPVSSKISAEDPIITTRRVAQVAIVVRDINKARMEWAEVLGVKPPEVSIAEGHFSRPTKYMNQPSDAKAKLAFFEMENLQIELIEPMGGKSTWQEFLDNHGEGLHHIAFTVKGIDGVEKRFEMKGMPTVQTGGWDGGAYSYVDASARLGCVLELLENFR